MDRWSGIWLLYPPRWILRLQQHTSCSIFPKEVLAKVYWGRRMNVSGEETQKQRRQSYVLHCDCSSGQLKMQLQMIGWCLRPLEKKNLIDDRIQSLLCPNINTGNVKVCDDHSSRKVFWKWLSSDQRYCLLYCRHPVPVERFLSHLPTLPPHRHDLSQKLRWAGPYRCGKHNQWVLILFSVAVVFVWGGSCCCVFVWESLLYLVPSFFESWSTKRNVTYSVLGTILTEREERWGGV